MLIVHRNQVNVKCFTLWRRPGLRFSGSLCSCVIVWGFGIDAIAMSALVDDDMVGLGIEIDR